MGMNFARCNFAVGFTWPAEVLHLSLRTHGWTSGSNDASGVL